MKEVESNLSKGIALSGASFAITIVVGLYVYKHLWIHLDQKEFYLWFLAFEVSQFLLLADLGFTHKFIVRAMNKPKEEVLKQLNELRFLMLMAATVTTGIFGCVVLWIGNSTNSLNWSLTCLGLSLFLTLVSYSETAALRAQSRNIEINIITIISQSIFVFALVFLPFPASISIGLAVFIRSALIYLLQLVRLRMTYAPRFGGLHYFGGEIVAINVSYFILFMLDTLFMGITVAAAAYLATILIVRKYFDLVRALWENLLPNLYVKFAEHNTNIYPKLIALSFFSYGAAACLANQIIPIWLIGFSSELLTYLALGLSYWTLTFFRTSSLRQFYKNSLSWKSFVATAVIAKMIFLAIVFSFQEDAGIQAAYFAQGVFILACVYYINIKAQKININLKRSSDNF